MLSEANIFPTIPVKDLEAAKMFYGQKLGLEQIDDDPGGVYYRCGNGKMYVYTSEYGGTNQATSASWQVKSTDSTVEELKAKGVVFEQYDNIPGFTREGDIHVMGDFRVAWFKDPDGNILAFDDYSK